MQDPITIRFQQTWWGDVELVPVCRHGIDTNQCGLCKEATCGLCRRPVVAPPSMKRRIPTRLCECAPDAIVDSEGKYTATLARFVPALEQYERKPVAKELKDRQFAQWLSNTGQVDLSDDMPDGYNETQRYFDPEDWTWETVAQEGTNTIFARDGLDLANVLPAFASQDMWSDHLNQLDVDEAADVDTLADEGAYLHADIAVFCQSLRTPVNRRTRLDDVEAWRAARQDERRYSDYTLK